MERVSCNPIDCPRADGYYDRINDALLRFLDDADDFSPAAICAFAQKERLCPFELALDYPLTATVFYAIITMYLTPWSA